MVGSFREEKTDSTTTGSSVVLSGLSFFDKAPKMDVWGDSGSESDEIWDNVGSNGAFSAIFFFRKNHFGAFWTILVGTMQKFVQKQGLVSPFLRFPVDGNRMWVGLATLSGERKLVR